MSNNGSAGFNDYDWDPERLRRLIDISGCSDRSVAKAADIAQDSMNAYMTGKTKPAIRALIKFAKLFAVPVDYLLGLCNEEQTELIFRDYKRVYQELRRTEYETLLLRHDRNRLIPSGFEAPYPYNLVDDIFGTPTDWILTDDQVSGLNGAIQSLNPREQEVLKYRYEDGLTLDEAGLKFDVGRERVRQIQAKALRKLRHPSRSKQILYGTQGYQELQEMYHTMNKLYYREKELNQKEERLRLWEQALTERTQNPEILQSVEAEWDSIESAEKLKAVLDEELVIEELDLSCRAFNCLKRSKINTLGELVKAYQTGTIIQIQNLGVKTATEIATKVKAKTGIDVLQLEMPA